MTESGRRIHVEFTKKNYNEMWKLREQRITNNTIYSTNTYIFISYICKAE